ncbi:hypothetical protein VTK73DRAFT_5906 [Phialemonium thermophilum]|uniref:Uncharacterized protein n=1 Tax=Phialemonium thermophilum TaxID=223376 RepID=A0ABR3V1J5_9PEZI
MSPAKQLPLLGCAPTQISAEKGAAACPPWSASLGIASDTLQAIVRCGSDAITNPFALGNGFATRLARLSRSRDDDWPLGSVEIRPWMT